MNECPKCGEKHLPSVQCKIDYEPKPLCYGCGNFYAGSYDCIDDSPFCTKNVWSNYGGGNIPRGAGSCFYYTKPKQGACWNEKVVFVIVFFFLLIPLIFYLASQFCGGR